MIDLDEFLAQSGIDIRTLERWVEREWLLPERREARIILSDMDAARAHLIHDLKGDFGVNDEGIEVVLHLVDQVHGLRRVLTKIRAEMRATRRGNIRRLRVHKPGRILSIRRQPR